MIGESSNLSSFLVKIPWVVAGYNFMSKSRVKRSGTNQSIKLNCARLRSSRIEILGDGVFLDFGENVRLFDCQILVRGQGTKLVLGDGVCLRRTVIVVDHERSRMTIGSGTTMTGAVVQSKEGGLVQIGEDCMVGGGTEILNSDGHSLFDEETGSRLNLPRDVEIGDHVWIGSRSWVGKGSQIGSGSMIAAQTRISDEIPSNVLVAGWPKAEVRRDGIVWTRECVSGEADATP